MATADNEKIRKGGVKKTLAEKKRMIDKKILIEATGSLETKYFEPNGKPYVSLMDVHNLISEQNDVCETSINWETEYRYLEVKMKESQSKYEKQIENLMNQKLNTENELMIFKQKWSVIDQIFGKLE